MRRFAVAAVLLACLMGTALAAGPTNGQPRKKTGATSCVEPITKIKCIVDPVSKFVLGLDFGFTAASMPAATYFRNCGSAATLTTGTAGATQEQELLPAANTANFISRVEVMKLKGAKNRGSVPLVRFYMSDAAGASVPNPGPGPLAGLPYVVCGDIANAAQYTTVAQNLTPPAPLAFLGHFTTKCAPRTLIKEASDASFALKSIEKPCWVPRP